MNKYDKQSVLKERLHLIYSSHKTQEYLLRGLSKEIFEDRGITAYAPDISEPNLNFAMQTNKIEGDLEDLLHKVETFYKARDLPWFWQLNSSRDQSFLKKTLHKCGYRVIEKYSTFIGSLEQVSLQTNLKNVTIKEVREELLSDWILPLREAFQSTEAHAQDYLKAHIRALHKKTNLHHFVAYIEGTPVSAGTLSLSSYGARLDDLGTNPSHQRKGIGSAMVLYQMKVAKNWGYERVYLDASQQGTLLYQSIGFQELCQNELYGKDSLKVL